MYREGQIGTNPCAGEKFWWKMRSLRVTVVSELFLARDPSLPALGSALMTIRPMWRVLLQG